MSVNWDSFKAKQISEIVVREIDGVDADAYQFRKFHSEACDPGWGTWQSCTKTEYICMLSHTNKQVRKLYSSNTLENAGIISVESDNTFNNFMLHPISEALAHVSAPEQQDVLFSSHLNLYSINESMSKDELLKKIRLLEVEIQDKDDKIYQLTVMNRICAEQAIESHRDDSFRTTPK